MHGGGNPIIQMAISKIGAEDRLGHMIPNQLLIEVIHEVQVEVSCANRAIYYLIFVLRISPGNSFVVKSW
jgi:hypothetical protein